MRRALGRGRPGGWRAAAFGPSGSRRAAALGTAGLLLLAAAAGCGGETAPEPRPPAEPTEGAASEADVQGTNAQGLPAHLSPLPAVEAEPVLGWTGPGGEPFEVATRSPGRVGHERRFGQRTLEVGLRGGERTHEPCTSCHLPGRPVRQAQRAADAHQDVQPVHPSESGQTCATCHARDDVERLVLEGGGRVELGHAYRLCGQCHFAQVDAWAAGAHGKRLDGWRGRRVVMGCADCHDPHSPAVERRIPFPGPHIPRTGRDPR